MTGKKAVVISSLIGLVIFFFLFAFVNACDKPCKNADEKMTLEEVKKQLSELFMNFEVDTVEETPIPGIYEVVDKKGQITYWSPKGYMFFGEIWTKTGKSMTAERRQELLKKKIEGLDLNDAVKVGNGETKIITFTNPDCPFCKRGYEYLSEKKDVTEYLFFMTFGNENTKKKVAYILCSENKEKAYKEVMTNSQKDINISNECMNKAENVINKHMSIAQSLGVRGTPTYFVKGKLISGANIPLLEKFINEK